ncbi:unnamed protein product [Caretta caretta]
MDKVGGTSGHARIRLCGNHQTLDVSWLNSSLQETLLPGKPWHKSSTNISERDQKKLEEDTRIWVKQQCLKAAERISCQFRLGNLKNVLFSTAVSPT